METIVLRIFITILLFFYPSYASRHHHHAASPSSSPTTDAHAVPFEIKQACKATLFPDQCENLLTQYTSYLPFDPEPLQIIQFTIELASDNLKTVQSMLRSIRDSSDDLNRTKVAVTCLEVLNNSDYRTSLAGDALVDGKIKDARAWMSAALAHETGCLSGLKRNNHTRLVAKTMVVLDSLNHITSTVLGMLRSLDIFGNDSASWKPPMTERDGFWEPSESVGGSSNRFGLRFPTKSDADAMVCKFRSLGCYKTVQEAVDAAPANGGATKFVIHITEGVYEETVRIPLEKKNVVFLGDGMGKTVITGSLRVGMKGISTYHTATVGVLGDGFMARDLTIENTAGSDAQQAVAFRSDSDRSVIENCEFVGNQDTLCALSLRQFYKSCRIVGNVDFIFGSSASVFQDCEILVTSRHAEKLEKGETNAIAAHGRTDPAQSTGFVFNNCLINGTVEYMKEYFSNPWIHKTFLGRPWKEYSRTVFIQCDMEALIIPEGWMPWDGDFALKTLYSGEFHNSGPGSNLSYRVSWSNTIPADHISTYSVKNFIQGDEWIPTSQKITHRHKFIEDDQDFDGRFLPCGWQDMNTSLVGPLDREKQM